jgi:hypothetical protein
LADISPDSWDGRFIAHFYPRRCSNLGRTSTFKFFREMAALAYASFCKSTDS